jgi:hypothetical protein
MFSINNVEKVFDDGNFFVDGPIFTSQFILIVKKKQSELCVLSSVDGVDERVVTGAHTQRSLDSSLLIHVFVSVVCVCIERGEGGRETREERETSLGWIGTRWVGKPGEYIYKK